MKVAKLYSFNDIRIEEMPIPRPDDDEALIKVKASGICSGDVMPWYIEKKAPLVLGHEAAGEIVETGRKVVQFRSGDRVFVHHHAPCMECSFCRRGNFVQCHQWKQSRIFPGGISEYILVPHGILSNDTLLLPDDVSYEDATLIEPTACVIKSLKRSNIRKGDNVVVIGLGFMGMLHILLARSFGASKVIGADMVDFRLQKAFELGADAAINVKQQSLTHEIKSLTNGQGAQTVIVGPNSVDAMYSGIQCVSPGGTVVLFTPARPGEKLVIDPNYLYFNDISITTSYSCGPDDTRLSLDFINKGVVKAEKLVTHRFGIDDTADAYRNVAEAKNSFKTLIIFS